jgi:hypothetical protein
MWLSMSEIRKHFGIERGTDQEDEWIACGFAALSRVPQIIPYNGGVFHYEPQMGVTCDDRIFNFQHNMWLLRDTSIVDMNATVFDLLKQVRTLENRQKAVQRSMQLITPRLDQQELDVWSKDMESLESLKSNYRGCVRALKPCRRDISDAILHQDYL